MPPCLLTASTTRGATEGAALLNTVCASSLEMKPAPAARGTAVTPGRKVTPLHQRKGHSCLPPVPALPHVLTSHIAGLEELPDMLIRVHACNEALHTT